MAFRPRGLSAPPFQSYVRPQPGGFGPVRGGHHVPPPMFGSGRPVPPPFRPPPYPHTFPMASNMPLRPPIPSKSLVRPRGHVHCNSYNGQSSARGKFAAKRGGGRQKGRGNPVVRAEVSGGKDSNYYCETCDRSFRSQDMLTEHLSQHQTCGLDGCQFTAHSAVVMRHVEMQHATGLYSKISAVSDNPEDIAKWISERKKRYPTRENIERQKKEHEEKMKRGERVEEDKSRFNRDFSIRRGKHNDRRGIPKGRGKKPAGDADAEGQNKPGKGKPAPRKIRRQAPTMSAFLSDDEENQNCRGKLPAFLGTAAFTRENEETEEEEEEENKFSDTEWDLNQERKPVSNDVAGPLTSVSKALSNIMGLYASGASESDEESALNGKQPENVQNSTEATEKPEENELQNQSKPCSSKDVKHVADSTVPVAHDDDSSGPEEVPIKKNLENGQPSEEQKENELKVHGASQSTGRKRKRVHRNRANKRKLEGQEENDTNTSKIQKSSEIPPQKNLPVKRRRRTLLEKLLSSEIRHERNLILQCVRYVINENFFDGSENEQKSQENNIGNAELTSNTQTIMDKILSNIRILRQCNRYVVQNNFFGVPCAEGSNCDEDEDD